MEAKIRKHRHTLFIAGYAVILSGIWDTVKTILNLTINQPLFRQVEEQAVAYTHEVMILSVVFAGVFIFILSGILMSIRLTIGRAAIRLGMGKETKSGAMIFWAVVLLIANASGVVLSVNGIFRGGDILNMTGSFLIDLTTFFMMVWILTALYKLKKLLSQTDGQTGG